jgi:hypothetical protein
MANQANVNNQGKHSSGGTRESPEDSHPRPDALHPTPGPRVEQEVGDAANTEELDVGPPPRVPKPDKPPEPRIDRAVDTPG